MYGLIPKMNKDIEHKSNKLINLILTRFYAYTRYTLSWNEDQAI